MAGSDKIPKASTSEREAKLAQALRANLRRRKAGAGAKVEPSGESKDAAKSIDEG